MVGIGFLDTRVKIHNRNTGLYGGDSFMAGANASPSSNAYRELLNSFYNWYDIDLSVGARGAWKEVDGINGYVAGWGRDTTASFLSADLNDIRRSHSAQTFNKIESSLKVSIKKILGTSSIIASGAAGVTRSGSFTQYDARTNGGIYGAFVLPNASSASFSSTINNTWTWSFTGTNCFVIWGASYPGAARGDCEVRIDGNLLLSKTDMDNRWDGVSDGSNNNQRGPDINFFWGLSSGAHSIEIKVTSAAAVAVDQLGVLIDPKLSAPAFVMQIPYVLDYDKTGLDQASDAYIDQVNDLRRSIVNEFKSHGYPVHWIPIMQGKGGYYYMDPGVTIDATDSVHPLNAGHQLIFESIRIRINYNKSTNRKVWQIEQRYIYRKEEELKLAA